MKQCQKGYALILTCILMPIVFLSLGLITFAFLKTRHSAEIKTVCRDQYHDYFSQIKSQILFIENLGPIAIQLYQTQLALIPFLWVPAVAKLYETLQKIRIRFDKLQSTLIKSFSAINEIRAYSVVGHLQNALHKENKKINNLLSHKSITDFNFNSKIQIVKKMDILFPPYARAPNIETKQAFHFNIKNQINPKSWIGFFKIERLSEVYSCSATLKSDSHDKLIINYAI